MDSTKVIKLSNKKSNKVELPNRIKKTKTDKVIKLKATDILTRKILVVVESPGKITKIQSYLGPNYIVKASYGHILSINPKGINIDLEKFEPKYEPIVDKKTVIRDLKVAYKQVDDLLIATDLDREGEMIAWSISKVLSIKNAKRIVFNDITQKSIMAAIQSPSTIDENMVNAQKCRTMLDKIVGYDLSSLVRQNITGAKSAGRVQSVVVRLIIDKEDDIRRHLEENNNSYYITKGTFDNKIASLLSKTKPFNIIKMDQDQVSPFLEFCKKAVFTVYDITKSPKSVKPNPPFTTSTLQQECSKRFGFSGKVTMQIAQKLYEAGLITYMRTDSTSLSDDALLGIEKYIINNIGKKYHKRTEYKNSDGAQEAHEAIRVTDYELCNIDSGLYENKVYSLIWKRTIASQMKNAEYLVEKVKIDISNIKDKYFELQTTSCIFDGFMKVYGKDSNEDDIVNDNDVMCYEIGSILNLNRIISEETYKEPPPRYNEASLINKLDVKNLNIGRPSTYANIIDKITDRKYVEIKDNICGTKKTISIYKLENDSITNSNKEIEVGGDTKKFVPTEIGRFVTEYLVNKFTNIVEYKFTANMEKSLDDIATNKIDWFTYMKGFYNDFSKLVSINKINVVKVNEINDINMIGEHNGIRYYKAMTRFGEAIRKIAIDTGDVSYVSVKPPYRVSNMNLQDAIAICKYPLSLGLFEEKPVILKMGNDNKVYIVWDNNNYNISKSGLKIDLEPDDITIDICASIIEKARESVKGILSDDKFTYSIKDGMYGRYILRVDKKTRDHKNFKIVSSFKDKPDLTLDDINCIIALHATNTKTKYKSKPKKN